MNSQISEIFKTHRKRFKRKRKIKTETKREQIGGEYKEDFGDDKNVLKLICKIRKEPVWYYFLLTGSLWCFMDTIMQAMIAVKYVDITIHQKSVFLVLAELFWIIDAALSMLEEYLEYNRPTLMCIALFSNTVISVLPIQFCFSDPTTYYLLGLNRMLRIINVVYIFYSVNSALNWKVATKFLQTLFLFIFFILMLSFFYTASVTGYREKFKNFASANQYVITAIYHSSKFLTMRGVGGRYFDSGIYVHVSFILISFLVFLFVFCLYTALITFIFCSVELQTTRFRYTYLSVKRYLSWKSTDESFVAQVNSYFKDMWNVCKGYNGYMGETRMEYGLTEVENLLPDSYKIQIQINMCLAALKHSMLFEDMDMAFLREIACIMKQQKFISKQYIYHQGELKDKMIYISSGVIQVISEEDTETAIFTLTNGSVLGETSLIIPYICSTNVQCLTKCTLHILERNELMQLVSKYPNYYQIIHKKVLERYSSTRHLHNIKQLLSRRKKFLFPRCLSAIWINYTLHKALGAMRPDNARKHIIDNIYIRDYINKNLFRKSVFTAKYLRLYSLAERDRIEGDSFFAKQTYPLALVPNTGLTLFWEIFICIMALTANIQIPYVTLTNSTEAVIYATIYFYTFLWLLDIVVQLRIAVKFKNYISINILEILTIRTQDPVFIIDFLSCFPLEFCYGLFIFNRTNLVYLNRMLKIVRACRLLRKWEYRYNNFNPMVIRIICLSFLLFYTAFLITCTYAYYKCAEKCTEKDLYYLLLYSLQIVASATLSLPSDRYVVKYPLLNVIIDTVLCTALIIAYSYIFTVFAYKNIHFQSICHHSNYIKCVVNNELLIRKLDLIIRTEFESANGLNFYSPTHIYRCLPKPLVGYFFKTTYLDWLAELPIFYGIPKFVVLEILQSTGYVKTFPPKSDIYLVGDLVEDLYILAEGCCIKLCGVTKKSTILYERVALNDLEICLEMPCRYMVQSLSHCEIILIKFIDLKRILHNYSAVCSIEECIDNMGNLKRNMVKVATMQLAHEVRKEHPISIISNIIFKSNMFQSLLMPTTFIPHANTFKYWECFRCVCALMSALLYTTTLVTLLPISHALRIIMIFLDLSAFVDLYIRFHVCYYNEKHILITHPHLTSKHYFKTSFLIDFIAVLPTQYLVIYPSYIFLNMNHVLQIHRYIGFIRYTITNNTAKLSKLYVFSYFPILILFLNICSSLYVINNCKFKLDEINRYYQVQCDKNSIFHLNNLNIEMTVRDCHVYAFYLAANSLTAVCFQGFEIVSNSTILLVGVCATVGFYCNSLLASNAFRYFMFEFKSVILYDEGKCLLFHYMAKWRVNTQLNKIVKTYLSKNIVYRKVCIEEALKLFGNHFLRDYKYYRFGIGLVKNCLIESTDFEPFIRNILLHSRYPVLLRDGVIYKLNDVLDETIFVYSGSILLTTSNNQVCISLEPGTIVGNLCCLYYNRMFSTVTALSNVELIAVKTSKFYEILQHFPSTEKQFRKLKTIHIDHIPGYKIEENPIQMDTRITIWNSKRGSILSTSLLIIGSYFSQILYLYQISISEFNILAISLSVLTDICYTASLIVERLFQKSCDNSIFEKDYFIHSSPRFNQSIWFLSVFAALPFDFFIYPIKMSPQTFYYMFIVCKCNVLLRNCHLYTYYRRIEKHIRLVNAKLFLLVLTNILVVYMCTAVLLVPSDLSPRNMNRHIDKKQLAAMTPIERYNVYLTWFESIAVSVSHLKQTVAPVSLLYTAIITIIALSIMYFAAFLFAITISLIFCKHIIHWKHNIEINKLNNYVLNTEISSTIINHISDYNELKWKRDSSIKFIHILNILPVYIIEALTSYRIGYIVEKHILFTQCHPDFSRQLYLNMKLDLYQCGDYIQFKGIVDECMYWIIYGTVVIIKEVSENNEIIIEHCKEGDCFGFPQGVLEGLPHLFSYRTTSETYLIILKRSKWEYLLPFFPASREFIYKQAWSIYYEDHMKL